MKACRQRDIAAVEGLMTSINKSLPARTSELSRTTDHCSSTSKANSARRARHISRLYHVFLKLTTTSIVAVVTLHNCLWRHIAEQKTLIIQQASLIALQVVLLGVRLSSMRLRIALASFTSCQLRKTLGRGKLRQHGVRHTGFHLCYTLSQGALLSILIRRKYGYSSRKAMGS